MSNVSVGTLQSHSVLESEWDGNVTVHHPLTCTQHTITIFCNVYYSYYISLTYTAACVGAARAVMGRQGGYAGSPSSIM